MSNTDYLKKTEADLLPPGFVHGHILRFESDGVFITTEIDGWNPGTREAIEICQSEAGNHMPKPGQKRKLSSDVLKLIFLKDKNLIDRGKVYVTSLELYSWFHQTTSWLAAACKHYSIPVELKSYDSKTVRRRVKNVMRQARREENRGAPIAS
ncbi:MAG: hypothetical protein RDU25_03285 [Patescibacteria group bacterium]|nr:hypothetical protein [Patescibacteria group bacterium]